MPGHSIKQSKNLSPLYWLKKFQEFQGIRFNSVSENDTGDFFNSARVGPSSSESGGIVVSNDIGAFLSTTFHGNSSFCGNTVVCSKVFDGTVILFPPAGTHFYSEDALYSTPLFTQGM
jgi:hypothetical protein